MLKALGNKPVAPKPNPNANQMYESFIDTNNEPVIVPVTHKNILDSIKPNVDHTIANVVGKIDDNLIDMKNASVLHNNLLLTGPTKAQQEAQPFNVIVPTQQVVNSYCGSDKKISNEYLIIPRQCAINDSCDKKDTDITGYNSGEVYGAY